MQCLLRLIFLFSFIYTTYSAILKTSMNNNYPQIAVLGCDSNKANLYYDIQRQVWVEHLVSSCVDNEQSILEFCQQAYPSLRIGNIVRLDTVLNFENWCELMPSNDDSIPRCKSDSQTNELVQPFRCLHINSKREELSLPTVDCTVSSLTGKNRCLRAEKWQQLATFDCSNKSMILNSSITTLDWCGLAQFRGVEFVCCPLKNLDMKNDYETSFDEQEDEPIRELIIAPTTTVETHRRIIAMSLGTREPNWMEDYRGWNTDSGYFADDEDINDDKEEIKLSSKRKSHLTMNEHERFTKDKDQFKKKYKQQIDQLTSSWRKRLNEIQTLANRNPKQAQNNYETMEIDFRQQYNVIKQTASQERTRINELHENKLDQILDNAKNETNLKLILAWKENPLKKEAVEEALYNYLHVLLRDRIHLVNRYERLRAVDPEQATRKRVSIHERLRSIANQINNALNNLRRYSELQSKIQPRIDTLLEEYDEVNKAADKLLIEYSATLETKTTTTATTTTRKSRILPLGRDEKRIYPFSSTQSQKIDDKNNNEYYYDTKEEYDDDDDDDDDNDDENTITTTTTEINNNEQIDVGDSDWDLDVDTDATVNIKSDSNIDELLYEDDRPLLPINDINKRPLPRNLFLTYLPYMIGSLLILCIIFGLLICRLVVQQRRKYRNGGKYEKNYAFTEVDSCSPEEKALHALQMNGYENPTYKFFENQTMQC